MPLKAGKGGNVRDYMTFSPILIIKLHFYTNSGFLICFISHQKKELSVFI